MDNLIEREYAIEQFSEAANCLNSTQGGLVLISGEAGVGKTSLLEKIKSEFGDKYEFLWTGCDPLFTPRPFGPIYDLRTSFAKQIVPLLKRAATPSTIFSAIYDALERVTDPTVLIVEDAHWADHATLDLLKFLARRISFLPCLLVISFRDDEIDQQHPLQSVLEVLPSAHTTRIQVQPLSHDGVSALTANSDRDSENLYKITGGNPFFVTELLASGSGSIPASIQEAINSRLAPLVKNERQFLETISVIPNAVSLNIITALFGADGETCAMACVARNLLTIDSNGDFRFRHELARLGTLTGVSVNAQQGVHARVIKALEEGDHNLGLLVHHATAALDGKRVLKYAPRAAALPCALSIAQIPNKRPNFMKNGRMKPVLPCTSMTKLSKLDVTPSLYGERLIATTRWEKTYVGCRVCTGTAARPRKPTTLLTKPSMYWKIAHHQVNALWRIRFAHN